MMPFCSFLDLVAGTRKNPSQVEQQPHEQQEALPYFHFGSALSGDGVYRFPLNRLRKDIPTPTFIEHNTVDGGDEVGGVRSAPMKIPAPEFSDTECSIRSFRTALAALWMGQTSSRDRMNSGLHFDVMDNLHIVVSGEGTTVHVQTPHRLHQSFRATFDRSKELAFIQS